MINYTIHTHALARPGIAKAPVPVLTAPPTGQKLALDTASAAIPGPCELRILPDEDVWLDVRGASGDLNTAASPLKLLAGQVAWFELGIGTFYIRGSAA